MPRVSCLDTGLIELFNNKLMGCILQAVFKAITWGTLLGCLIKILYQLTVFLLGSGGRKDQRLVQSKVQFEFAWDEQILLIVPSTSSVLAILYILVPMRVMPIALFLAQLHI